MTRAVIYKSTIKSNLKTFKAASCNEWIHFAASSGLLAPSYDINLHNLHSEISHKSQQLFYAIITLP